MSAIPIVTKGTKPPTDCLIRPECWFLQAIVGAQTQVAMEEKKVRATEFESLWGGLSLPGGMMVFPQLVFADVDYRGPGSRTSSVVQGPGPRPRNCANELWVGSFNSVSVS